MSMLLSVINYARNEMPDAFGDITLGERGTEIKALAEIMRRINYNPDPRDLQGEGRLPSYQSTFVEPITDPKAAARAYRNFAQDMNEPTVNSLRKALERRAAGLPPVDWKKELVWRRDEQYTDEGRLVPNAAFENRENMERFHAERAAQVTASAALASSQAIEAVVDRLLEETPLDDARWGGW